MQVVVRIDGVPDGFQSLYHTSRVQPKETSPSETLVQTNVAGEILSRILHRRSRIIARATGGGRIPSKKIIIPVDATERLSESERPIVLPLQELQQPDKDEVVMLWSTCRRWESFKIAGLPSENVIPLGGLLFNSV